MEFLQSSLRRHFKGETTGGVAKGRLFSKATIVDKSLGTLAFLERFPVHTSPTPPLTPQTTFYACKHNFSKFQLFLGWGKKYLQENPEKDRCTCFIYEGTQKLPKIMNTVLLPQRTFVLDFMIEDDCDQLKRQ